MEDKSVFEVIRENPNLKKFYPKFLETALPCLKIEANVSGEPLANTASKFGGDSYLICPSDYPKDPEGKPLIFLAQLNFSEMPTLDKFPTDGVLQFYISDNSMFGVDPLKPNDQKYWRVIYRSKEDIKEDLHISEFKFPKPREESFFPVTGEFSLSFTEGLDPIPENDFRFSKIFENELYQLDLPKKDIELLEELLWRGGHKVGGYPLFIQSGLQKEKVLQKYDRQLLQVASQYSVEGKSEISWGDAGVAKFLISENSLIERDFSDIIYTWDCS